MSVYLIRHGESTANTGEDFGDPIEIGLTKRGKEQAKHIAQSVGNAKKIITSHFRRSQETAVPLRKKFPDATYEIWQEIHEFTYLDPNKFRQGQMTIIQKNLLVDQYWKASDPFYGDGGNAESFAHFFERVRNTILKLTNQHLNTFVFTHGNFIKLFIFLNTEYKNKISQQFTADEIREMMERFCHIRNNPLYQVQNGQIIDCSLLP